MSDLILLIFLVLIILIVLIALIILGRRHVPFSGIKVDELVGGKQSNLRIKNLQKHPRSRSEAEVIRYLEEITGKSFPTAYPKWLVWKGHTLELDGYNEELGIALEFSGPLHTKWTPSKEPYSKYFERVVRDIVKRRLCHKYKVYLIVVDASLPSRHWRDYVLSRLYDFHITRDNTDNTDNTDNNNTISRPPAYIPEQIAEPFRNEQLERELGLTNEIEIAMRL